MISSIALVVVLDLDLIVVDYLVEDLVLVIDLVDDEDTHCIVEVVAIVDLVVVFIIIVIKVI